MAVLTLSNTVLLRGMGTGYLMGDTRALKIAMKTMILATPIGLDSCNLAI
jgi:hypothetical protein